MSQAFIFCIVFERIASLRGGTPTKQSMILQYVLLHSGLLRSSTSSQRRSLVVLCHPRESGDPKQCWEVIRFPFFPAPACHAWHWRAGAFGGTGMTPLTPSPNCLPSLPYQPPSHLYQSHTYVSRLFQFQDLQHHRPKRSRDI